MRRADLLAVLALVVALPIAAGPAPIPVAAPAPAVDDSALPVDIQADFGELDRAAGRGTYRGNVIVQQGSTRITADEVRILLEGDTLARVEIEGQPATFVHQATGAPQPTHGMARSMVYLVRESLVELKGDARVEQHGNDLASDTIRYDLKGDRVVAAGGEQPGERVRVTITPREKERPAEPQGDR